MHTGVLPNAELTTDAATTAALREGQDFTTAQELADRAQGRPDRKVRPSLGFALAQAALAEVRWMLWHGLPSGAVAWDQQPAWRVELWETFFREQERVAALSDRVESL